MNRKIISFVIFARIRSALSNNFEKILNTRIRSTLSKQSKPKNSFVRYFFVRIRSALSNNFEKIVSFVFFRTYEKSMQSNNFRKTKSSFIHCTYKVDAIEVLNRKIISFAILNV